MKVQIIENKENGRGSRVDKDRSTVGTQFGGQIRVTKKDEIPNWHEQPHREVYRKMAAMYTQVPKPPSKHR